MQSLLHKRWRWRGGMADFTFHHFSFRLRLSSTTHLDGKTGNSNIPTLLFRGTGIFRWWSTDRIMNASQWQHCTSQCLCSEALVHQLLRHGQNRNSISMLVLVESNTTLGYTSITGTGQTALLKQKKKTDLILEFGSADRIQQRPMRALYEKPGLS